MDSKIANTADHQKKRTVQRGVRKWAKFRSADAITDLFDNDDNAELFTKKEKIAVV